MSELNKIKNMPPRNMMRRETSHAPLGSRGELLSTAKDSSDYQVGGGLKIIFLFGER